MRYCSTLPFAIVRPTCVVSDPPAPPHRLTARHFSLITLQYGAKASRHNTKGIPDFTSAWPFEPLDWLRWPAYGREPVCCSWHCVPLAARHSAQASRMATSSPSQGVGSFTRSGNQGASLLIAS